MSEGRRPQSVLFACGHNVIRSPMAEALARYYFGGSIFFASAGVRHKALDLTRILAAEVEYWPTPDPSFAQGNRQQRLEAYRDVRDLLIKRITARLGG